MHRWAKGPIDAAGAAIDHDVMSGAAQARTPNGPQRPESPRAVRERQSGSIITRTGERVLRAELDRLRHQLEVEFAARLRDARAFGEVAGNDEYLQIKEEEAVLAAGIGRLEHLLASTSVIDDAAPVGGVVAIGTVVDVEDLDSGAVEERLLVGGYERLIPEAASADSPVGRALMGRAVGDEVVARLPGARKRRLRIAAIRHPDRA